MTLKEGYKLKEFEIKRVLGKGGFGITYLAFDTLLKKDVAIKEFFPKELVDRDSSDNSISLQTIEGEESEEKSEICLQRYQYFLKKFVKEAQIIASLEHQNIVKVIRYFEENNTAYFVMNYIKGESLKKYIQRIGKLTQEQILDIILPILEGLKIVHKAGFLHRDIAPDNIYLTQNGKPILLDFGAAKSTIVDKQGEEVSIGIIKKGYSAPEQHYDDSIHTVSTDIYSVAAVIVFCLEGKMPPTAPQRTLAQPDPLELVLESYKEQCSQGFIRAIKKSMNLQAKNRFQDVVELQKALITKRITLKRFIVKQDKKLTQKEILFIINQVFDKLELLHAKGSTHSNISPENIYIKDDNVIELGRPMEKITYTSNSLTEIRNIGYSSPEQYSSESEDTVDTDLYSIGAVMFFMITSNTPPESTKRLTEVYSKKNDSIQKSLNKYKNIYGKNFLNAIYKSMELNSNNRFQDIKSFREQLSGEEVSSSSFKKIVLITLALIFLGLSAYFIKEKDTAVPPLVPSPSSIEDNESNRQLVTKVPLKGEPIEESNTSRISNGSQKAMLKALKQYNTK